MPTGLIELMVIVGQAAQAAAPAAPPDGEETATIKALLELGKLVGTGGATTFALLAWQALRHERGARRDDRKVRIDRQRELDDRLERLSETVARIDERTGLLIAEHLKRGRARTSPRGVPVLPPAPGRKPTSSDD